MLCSDWSSYVCSSGLIARDFAAEPVLAADLRESVAKVRQALGLPEAAADGYRRVADYREKALGARAEPTLRARAEQARSEERRGGKEGGSTCRSGWEQDH